MSEYYCVLLQGYEHCLLKMTGKNGKSSSVRIMYMYTEWSKVALR